VGPFVVHSVNKYFEVNSDVGYWHVFIEFRKCDLHN